MGNVQVSGFGFGSACLRKRRPTLGIYVAYLFGGPNSACELIALTSIIAGGGGFTSVRSQQSRLTDCIYVADSHISENSASACLHFVEQVGFGMVRLQKRWIKEAIYDECSPSSENREGGNAYLHLVEPVTSMVVGLESNPRVRSKAE